MDQKCEECRRPIQSWRCKCPSNHLNQPDPPKKRAATIIDPDAGCSFGRDADGNFWTTGV